MNQTDSPVWIGVRQKDFCSEAEGKLSLIEGNQKTRIGITAYYNENYHYEIYLGYNGKEYEVCLAKQIHDIQVVTVKQKLLSCENIWLKISADNKHYHFLFSLDGKTYTELGTGVTAGLCTETTMAMTYTGVYFAMFAENGTGYFQNFKVLNHFVEK